MLREEEKQMNTCIYKVLNRIVYFDRLLLRRVQLHREW